MWWLAGVMSSIALAGCVSNEPGSSSTAHAVIEYATAEAIGDELVRVFEADGYEAGPRSSSSLVFTRAATQRDIVLFGEFATGEITMQVTASIKPRGEYAHLVLVDVEAVYAKGGSRQVGVIGSRPYQDLLDQAKASLVAARAAE